jgi:glycosyltransferase involved in cell wall biosynthesis
MPTYQRATVLLKNLRSLARLIRREAGRQIRVRIRDNASDDDTVAQVRAFAADHDDIDWIVTANPENIGGEPNCLVLLEEATAEHVMFLGDDDFLPDGYLKFVLDEITARPEMGVIVSGYSDLFPTGEVLPCRYEAFDLLRLEPGCEAMFQLMPLGHQLSGLVLKREGLARAYLDLPDHRNLYPFIYFIGNRCRNFPSIYAPKYQTRVSVAVTKYWSYDRSALMRHVFTNYEAVFAGQPLNRMRGQLAFMKRNWARVGGGNILRLPTAFPHVIVWRRLDWLTRMALIGCLPWLTARSVTTSAVKLVRRVRAAMVMPTPRRLHEESI